MISRLPFALPPRGSPARLPFLLVPVLTLAAVVQLAAPERVDLPPGGLPARIGQTTAPVPPGPVPVPPAITARDPFLPISNKPPPPKPPPPPPPDPLRDAVIAGVVEQGGKRLGVVQYPNGAVGSIAVGGQLAGWRLDALTAADAHLSRGRHRKLVVAYGMHPSPPLPRHARGKPADDQ